MRKTISWIISLMVILSLLALVFLPTGAAEEETVLFYDDFSSDTLSNYSIIEQTDGATVSISGGRLHLNSAASKDHFIRILLPESVVSDNIRITVKANYVESSDANRWLATMFNVQNDGGNNKPYNQFAIRKTLNRTNGLEHAQPDATWNVKEKFQLEQPNIDPSVNVESVVHLNSGYCALVYNGAVVRDTKALASPKTLSGGRVGLQVNGLYASIDSIEITETAARYDGTIADATTATTVSGSVTEEVTEEVTDTAKPTETDKVTQTDKATGSENTTTATTATTKAESTGGCKNSIISPLFIVPVLGGLGMFVAVKRKKPGSKPLPRTQSKFPIRTAGIAGGSDF